MSSSVLLLIICIILVSLSMTLIVLFMKHIKTMNILTEEFRKEQEMLYKKIESNLDDENNQKMEVKSNDNKPNNSDTNLNTTTLKSSKVSQEQLSELIKDKEQVFKKEVTIQPGSGFIDLNIDISKK